VRSEIKLVPTDLRRSLEVLSGGCVKAETSRAAMAAWSFFQMTGEGPFLRAPRDWRSHTHIGHGKNNASLCFHVRGPDGREIVAIGFSDQSLLLGRGCEDGLEIFPHVFSIKDLPGKPRIDNSARRQDLARLALEGVSELLDEASLETFASPSLDAIRRDLLRLAVLFERRLWIAPPTRGSYPVKLLDRRTACAHALPAEAAGRLAHWPPFLPHDLTLPEDADAARDFLQDLVDYAAATYADRAAGFAYKVLLATPGAAPIIQIHCRKTSRPRDAMMSIDYLLGPGGARAFPVPSERLEGLRFTRLGSVQHDASRITLCEGRSRPVSNHQRIRLRGRFGTLPPDILV